MKADGSDSGMLASGSIVFGIGEVDAGGGMRCVLRGWILGLVGPSGGGAGAGGCADTSLAGLIIIT